MTDSNYIPAAERQYALEVLEGSKPTGVLLITAQQNATMSALRSHVVADSVMHELAQTLRDLYDGGDDICSCWRCQTEGYGPCHWATQIKQEVEPVLKRFDALTKGET